MCLVCFLCVRGGWGGLSEKKGGGKINTKQKIQSRVVSHDFFFVKKRFIGLTSPLSHTKIEIIILANLVQYFEAHDDFKL